VLFRDVDEKLLNTLMAIHSVCMLLQLLDYICIKKYHKVLIFAHAGGFDAADKKATNLEADAESLAKEAGIDPQRTLEAEQKKDEAIKAREYASSLMFIAGRWQNYILYYIVVIEIFLILEFMFIANKMADSAHLEHQGLDRFGQPIKFSSWNITCIFIVFMGFKSGFYLLKTRYYIMGIMLDCVAFSLSFMLMGHIVSFKDIFSQVLILSVTTVTGLVSTVYRNNKAMLIFENMEKSHATTRLLSSEIDKINSMQRELDEKVKDNQIMISYAHKDSLFAFKVRNELVKRGYKVWIDDLISKGEDWRGEIGNAILKSKAIVFCVSPKSVGSKYCTEELVFGSGCKVPIYPLTFQDAFKDLKGSAKLILQRIQWTNFECEEYELKNSDGTPDLNSDGTPKKKLIKKKPTGDVYEDTVFQTFFEDQLHNLLVQIEKVFKQTQKNVSEGKAGVSMSSLVFKESVEITESFDAFICCDNTDKAIAEMVRKDLISRGVKCAPLASNLDETAEYGLASECIVLVQTQITHSKNASGSDIAATIHECYENNKCIVVLRFDDDKLILQQYTASMLMMLQQCALINCTYNTGGLDPDQLTEIVYYVLHPKYGKAVSANAPKAIDMSSIGLEKS